MEDLEGGAECRRLRMRFRHGQSVRLD
jgi:hypothetical protein